MARYIKAVECADIISERFNIPLSDLVDVFAEIPTADVVPKSEVARLEQDVTRLVQENETLKDNNEHLAVMLEETKIELESMRGAANSYKMHYESLAREIFEEIEKAVAKGFEYGTFFDVQRNIAELKKKYTEGKNDN